MKIFELYDQNTNVKCLIIGGQHGNEPVGIDICKKLTKITPANNGLHIIPIANRPAFTQKSREFNGVNLNRSYGEKSTNILELDEMIDTIKNLAANAAVVIDCHSTPMKDLGEISIYPNNNAVEIAPLMGLPFYIQKAPQDSLRYFCDQHGVAAITFEGIDELHEESVEIGVGAILRLLSSLKLL